MHPYVYSLNMASRGRQPYSLQQRLRLISRKFFGSVSSWDCAFMYMHVQIRVMHGSDFHKLLCMGDCSEYQSLLSSREHDEAGWEWLTLLCVFLLPTNERSNDSWISILVHASVYMSQHASVCSSARFVRTIYTFRCRCESCTSL